MPGRGKAGGKGGGGGRGSGNSGGRGNGNSGRGADAGSLSPGSVPQRGDFDDGGGQGRAGKHDGGVDMGTGERTWSNAPGQMKKEAGEQSARDFAPGHGGEPPGQVPRDSTANAAETQEPDSLDREA
jgi:hypothetical protein